MARYTVQHAYTAYKDGERVGPWVAGDEVDLDDDQAAWVGRDSPGVLEPTRSKPPRRGPGRPKNGGSDG